MAVEVEELKKVQECEVLAMKIITLKYLHSVH